MATVKNNATVIQGKVGNVNVEIMLDSGSAVSLLRQNEASLMETHPISSGNPFIELVTASGKPLPILSCVEAPIQMTNTIKTTHQFLIVHSLIYPVILGTDFLYRHQLSLDFTSIPVTVHQHNADLQDVQPMWNAEVELKTKRYATAAIGNSNHDVVDECSIPQYNKPISFDMPPSNDTKINGVLNKYQHLFRSVPGITTLAYHHIPTTGNPIRVPPRKIPGHYKHEVEHQIREMLQRDIIEESCSPWLAPAVFVRKKSGDIRLCIDYRELNKKTQKDTYPLPLPDEVQDKLANSSIFSTLDLQCGYWQLPVHPDDRHKTAFCPGPGMGLFQFKCMPFGLTGAPSSFQRMMNQLFRKLPFVTVYIDDILIHSANKEQHIQHLQHVFKVLSEANLTLRGSKCHLAMSKVSYLGHVFSATGMSPDPQKVSAVKEWLSPTNAEEVRKFLGLASYYRRYILGFSHIAKPLHTLTQKQVSFNWSDECEAAFNTLKEKLVDAPVLSYPQFDKNSPPFVLQTDASAVGVGAVLEQGGHVIGYASRALNTAEQQYSVIQKECLAIVFAMKQFRHYLLGRPFELLTDHSPLQWLSSQKMEGLLCRWALAMQEFDFIIKYRKGSQNGNADALSRNIACSPTVIAATQFVPDPIKKDIQEAQQADPTLQIVYEAMQKSNNKPTSRLWHQSPLSRYRKLWPQLCLCDGVLCRKYTPQPLRSVVTVPILPQCLQEHALYGCHDTPSAGHQGFRKTLENLRREAYWVHMVSDAELYCRQCPRCQQSKLPLPTRAPLKSTPIGRPWQMVGVDILSVPTSCNGNKCLLVIQDYFTKWADAIPLSNQKAVTITNALIHLFATMGLPDIVHSDQGQNFESTVLKQTLDAFGIQKSHTTAYHPQGDGLVERFNRSLLQLLRAYIDKHSDWEQHLPLALYAYRTAIHSSTGVSPHFLMFGREPHSALFDSSRSFDPSSYQHYLRAKLSALQDFVESNLVVAGEKQKAYYDEKSQLPAFTVNDKVWLSVPTANKLEPRWKGRWKVTLVKSPVTVAISDGKRTRVVHTNRLRHRIQAAADSSESTLTTGTTNVWSPPQIEHFVEETVTPSRRNPPRSRRAPQYYRP